MSRPEKSRVLVTGGAGYVGAELVPRLLERGHHVRVLDLFLYDRAVFDSLAGEDSRLDCVVGDIRDQGMLRRVLQGVDTVLHLACISNDPSFELDPKLSRSINFDAFEPLVRLSRKSGVRRFIYVSSSSVYGLSEDSDVTEDHPLRPLTDYSRYKALCEPILLERQATDFTTVVVRPATVCGYSRRLRLDLAVNILTNHAVNEGRIRIFGGTQKRANVHIRDVCELYSLLVEVPADLVAGETFNLGHRNSSLMELGRLVQETVLRLQPRGDAISLEVTPSDDLRSYQISSEKLARRLGFKASRTVEAAVEDLCRAFWEDRVPNPMADVRYYNVRALKQAALA